MKFYINLIIAEKSIIKIFFILFLLHKKRLEDFSFNLDNTIYKINKKKIKIINKLAKTIIIILYKQCHAKSLKPLSLTTPLFFNATCSAQK